MSEASMHGDNQHPIQLAIDGEGVATLTLNRPDVHNAFDDHLIAGLTARLRELDHAPDVRVVVLAGNGKSFSAGADLNWMKRMAGFSEGENLRDAVANGATLKTRTRVTRVRVEGGRVVGVEWRAADGSAGGAAAPLIVNAAGPWVDEVLGPIQHTRLLGGTKGSHVIVPPFPGAPRTGVYVEAGVDARPFFILPWNGLLLIGTTDERFEGDAGAAAIDSHETRRSRSNPSRRRV